MNFGMVLGVVSSFLEERGYRHAAIGAVALAALGLLRTTQDLDLIVEAPAQPDLLRFLEARGYRTLHRSSGYSNHSHPDPAWGRIDFVYVQGETSDTLFSSCSRLRGPGDIEIPVPRPEHLAALKVVAMKNNPSRELQDLADVRFLLTLPGVDRVEVQGYFERHGLESRFDEIERTL
ncbi:MAG: nucleotidyl transferase AbiEii/AbiGii toxin family protein [Thermoanaerobaculia bacterium]